MTSTQITPRGKALAGFLLITFTLTPLIFIMGFWPDQMPENVKHQWYRLSLFNIQWIDPKVHYAGPQIHINTILFLLVSLAGFLGSMVHLSTSLTNYVGSEKFCRSWTLWYFVKPFTAAGLALVFYLVLQAGLLNGNPSNSVNPYGMVVLAALVGIFTDKATLKLEEIFTVLFKPADQRPDKMERKSEEKGVKVTSVEPKQLSLQGENKIILTGEGFSSDELVIKMEDKVMEAIITTQSITFPYKVDPASEKKEMTLQLVNKKEETVYTNVFAVEEINVPEPEEEEAVG